MRHADDPANRGFWRRIECAFPLNHPSGKALTTAPGPFQMGRIAARSYPHGYGCVGEAWR